jgi:hypothetical protein
MKAANNEFKAWDAFIGFMEDIFYPGIIEESSPEFINFHWVEFKNAYC